MRVTLQEAQRKADDFKVQVSGYNWRIQVLETSESLGRNREAGLKARLQDLQSEVEVGASVQAQLEQQNSRTKVAFSPMLLNKMLLGRCAHRKQHFT